MADEAAVVNVEESKPVALDTETPVVNDTVETKDELTNEDADSKVEDEGFKENGAAAEEPNVADVNSETPETREEVNGEEEESKEDCIAQEEISTPEEPKSESTKVEEVEEEEQKVEEKETEDVETKSEEKDEAPKTAEKVEKEKEVKGDVSVEETEKEAEEAGPFNGIFVHTESENLEPFLVEVGIGWIMRKVALNTTPTNEVQQKGNDFIIKFQTGPMSRMSKFTIGEEFEDKDPSGELATVRARIEDGKLIQYYEPKEGSKAKPLQVTREIDGDFLIQTMEVGSVKCTRKFKRKS